MKREIKFRAWDSKMCLMIENNEMAPQRSKMIFGTRATLDSILTHDDYDVTQYTGLKDKNGVDIYEGDIVRKPNDLWIGKKSVGDNKGTFATGVIEYVEGSFRINKPGDSSKNYFGVLNYSSNNQSEVLEIIGNIYENPELINN